MIMKPKLEEGTSVLKILAFKDQVLKCRICLCTRKSYFLLELRTKIFYAQLQLNSSNVFALEVSVAYYACLEDFNLL